MQTLTVGCGAYDRTWPLIAGHIRPQGAQFDWKIMPPEEVFVKGMLTGAFDICEMSSATSLILLSRGQNHYTALPLFVSRKFRHGAIFVRADSGIERPEDLRGRVIGVPEWQLTAIVWVRGILSDVHGVKLSDARWLIGDPDTPGRVEKVPVDPPAGVNWRRLAGQETLWQMMLDGECDAIIGPRAPRAFHDGDPRVRRIFPDIEAAETGYWQQTGLFPIMHVVGIRNDLLARDPSLVGRVYDAFEAGRKFALNELHQVAYDACMLPWQGESLARTQALMGPDYWTYGLEGNHACVDTLCRYAHEQGLTGDRRITPADLFPVGPV